MVRNLFVVIPRVRPVADESLEWSMDVNQLIRMLVEFVQEHWLKALGALALTVASSLFGAFWAWRSWRTREDMDVIHYSQNTIETRPTGPDGSAERWLILDVYAENPLHEEISHPVPRRLIQRAAAKTTPKQPFLLLPKHDRWYVLNLIRLAIAEQFRLGTAAKFATSAKVEVVECVFALTFERYANMPQGKIRVMIAKQKDMENPDAFAGNFRFESATHSDRITTLQCMQEDYRSGRENWKYCETVRVNIQL
jgi:hypothetical protein